MTEIARMLRERWWTWAIPLALALIGVGLLVNYLLALSGEGRSLLANVDRTAAEVAQLQGQSRRLEARIEALSYNQEQIELLYDERLSTEGQRLTQILTEVKDLATRSGLKPSALSYADDEFQDFGLTRKSFSFGVTGNYRQLRQLIHLLEHSKSFLTLEQIGLSESGGSGTQLRIQLRISTLFAAAGEA